MRLGAALSALSLPRCDSSLGHALEVASPDAAQAIRPITAEGRYEMRIYSPMVAGSCVRPVAHRAAGDSACVQIDAFPFAPPTSGPPRGVQVDIVLP